MKGATQEMNEPLLLAKSKSANGKSIRLIEHSEHVLQCALEIFRIDSRIGRNWKRFFRLSDEQYDAFVLNLSVAALWHDIGKANKDFLTAVSCNSGFYVQAFRHEHISALLLFEPEVQRWLTSPEAKNKGLDFDVMVAAVLSHHLKSTLKSDETQSKNTQWFSMARLAQPVPAYFNHPDVCHLLHRIQSIVCLSNEPPLLPSQSIGDQMPYRAMYQTGRNRALGLRKTIPIKSERNRLLLAVKAGLILADSAGSGLVRVGQSIDRWIVSTLHQTSITADCIESSILRPRAKQIEARFGKSFEFKPFQENIGSQGKRILLLASCAAGKTLAGWKWAKQMCQEHEIGRILFLYPTRGTATEGFRDYVGWAPETEIGLDHGTSQYELESMQTNPPESLRGKNIGLSPEDEKLYALGMWGKRYLSATVDQFLGFMELQYGSLCKLPMLVDSAVIIDEVHSFDPLMFGSLVAFLKQFDVPVLCMTATLPLARTDQLKAAGLTIYTADEDEKLREQSEKPRYRHRRLPSQSEAVEKAIIAFHENKRILWVVNTVDRCQAIADELELRLGTKVLTYHSRFTLCDRQKVHGFTVDAFQQVGQRAIAVTTQVCEMSLDLDAQVLITEDAPVPSLVQRMGRANRHLKEDFADVVTYAPAQSLPYIAQELQDARAFLQAIGDQDVSQARLSELLEFHTKNVVRADDSSSFLSSGYFAVPCSFRDTDEYALPCILNDETTIAEVHERLTIHKSIDGFVVNVPRPDKLFPELNEHRPAWLPRHIYLADHRHYDTDRGFRKERANG
jgi:CRISPR-associated endonuclease/helicase Cas3